MEWRSRSRSVMDLTMTARAPGIVIGQRVRRPQHQDALEARHGRRGRADECLARAPLADDVGTLVGFEGQGRASE